MTKETIVKELIRVKKEALKGSSRCLTLNEDNIEIKEYIDYLLNALVQDDYENELRDVWDFEIEHIHESYCRDLKKALTNHDVYSFVVEQRCESKKADYIKSHWNELDKMMNTLYNLCGLNVIEVEVSNED